MGLVTVTASHSAFIGAVPEQCLDFSWTPAISADNWRAGFLEHTDRGQAIQVAVAEDRVVGFIWTRPWADSAGFDVSVHGLYVLPSWHRQGVGRQLMSHGVSGLLQDGIVRSLEIGCIRENPACDFYRKLGGVETGRRAARVDSFETEEILFGWNDPSILIARAPNAAVQEE